ncbi:MAG TPA: iron-containing alcohol dehydrogenase [Caulobacteraceae bacterium]|nr:iron-containing alcohol dehydrogenase [Caulobacteraceae bacterium]
MTRDEGQLIFPPMERVIYGKPAAQAVREEAERLKASRIFLVVSRTLNTTTDEIQKVRDALGGRYAGTFDGVPQHTTRTSAIAVAMAAAEAGADLLVAIGGGSVVDVVKIAIMCIEHEITAEAGLDGYERVGSEGGVITQKHFRSPRVRTVVVPTTLSGGEYNMGALVTDTSRGWKQTFAHPEMMPRSIILDAAIARHTPETLWLGSGTRAMDHGIEALLSPAGNPLVDAVVTQGIADLAQGLVKSRAAPDDLELRALCQRGSWLAAFGLQCRVPMGASHAIGHVLGGTIGVPHYLITPTLMPHVLRYNKPVTQEAQSVLARALGEEGTDAADALERLVARLGLPGRLADVGVQPSDFPKIADVAVKSVFARSNPRPLARPQDVIDLLETQGSVSSMEARDRIAAPQRGV